MFLQRFWTFIETMRPKTLFSWISIFVFLICIAFSLTQAWSRSVPQLTFMQGLQQCADNTNDDSQLTACSRQVVSAQLQTHSAADLMDDIATATIPKKYGDCHGIAHIIGQETYNKYSSVERAINECSQTAQTCYGGCVHGIVAGAVTAEFGASDPGTDIAHMDVGQIEKIGAKYCNSSQLCHAIGHILYYATGDFEKAAQACGQISSGFVHEMCISGTFMQGVGDIHHSLALSDSSLQQPSKSDGNYAYPCDTISTKYLHQCFLYVPSFQETFFQANGIDDYPTRLKIAKKNCENQQGVAREYCFEGIGYAPYKYILPENKDYLAPALQICQSLPTLADQKSCVLGFVEISRGYGYTRQSYNFCSSLASAELQTFCYIANFEYLAGPNGVNSAEFACRYAKANDQCIAAHKIYESEYKTLPDYRFGLYGLQK